MKEADKAFIEILTKSIAERVGDRLAENISCVSGDALGLSREKPIFVVGYTIPANNEKRITTLAGPGKIVGGSLVIRATDEPLRDMTVKIISDANIIVNDSIYSIKQYSITDEDLAAVYVSTYEEDFTSVGSWVTSKTGNFKYIIRFSESCFDESYEVYLKNSSTTDRNVNLFMRYYYWGVK